MHRSFAISPRTSSKSSKDSSEKGFCRAAMCTFIFLHCSRSVLNHRNLSSYMRLIPYTWLMVIRLAVNLLKCFLQKKVEFRFFLTAKRPNHI